MPPARPQELRKLFTLNVDTKCDTADLLHGSADHKRGGGGGRDGSGGGSSSGGGGGAASFRDVSGACEDGPLAAAVAAGLVSFVHLDPRQLQQPQQQPQQKQQQKQPQGRSAVAGAAREEDEERGVQEEEGSEPGASAGRGEGERGGSEPAGAWELEMEEEEGLEVQE